MTTSNWNLEFGSDVGSWGLRLSKIESITCSGAACEGTCTCGWGGATTGHHPSRAAACAVGASEPSASSAWEDAGPQRQRRMQA